MPRSGCELCQRPIPNGRSGHVCAMCRQEAAERREADERSRVRELLHVPSDLLAREPAGKLTSNMLYGPSGTRDEASANNQATPPVATPQPNRANSVLPPLSGKLTGRQIAFVIVILVIGVWGATGFPGLSVGDYWDRSGHESTMPLANQQRAPVLPDLNGYDQGDVIANRAVVAAEDRVVLVDLANVWLHPGDYADPAGLVDYYFKSGAAFFVEPGRRLHVMERNPKSEGLTPYIYVKFSDPHPGDEPAGFFLLDQYLDPAPAH